MGESSDTLGALDTLVPVERRSISDAVFEQLRDQILSGARSPGDPLPPERLLCEALGVNRGSVREALRRLEQARLVSVRHGGASLVLDYRAHAGLDLIGSLVVRGDGHVDTHVVGSIMEMRSAIAPDAARRAAQRRTAAQVVQIETAARALTAVAGDLATAQDCALDFWSLVIDASGNLAYRLAYNALRETYVRAKVLLAPVLAAELRDAEGYAALAAAIGAADDGAARALAERLVAQGEDAVAQVLRRIESQKPHSNDEETRG